jgi:hypothetical protein
VLGRQGGADGRRLVRVYDMEMGTRTFIKGPKTDAEIYDTCTRINTFVCVAVRTGIYNIPTSDWCY